MKLYDSRRAPNPRRVRWFMAEKRIEDVEIVDVSIFDGDHKTAVYLSKAGLPHVPALEIDAETTITESVAICRYLESVYPEPNLFGRDAKEIAVIEMWMRRVEMMVSTPMMMAVRHSHPAMAGIETQVPEVAQNNLGMAERALKVLDRRLAESPFIAADRVTMADILAITAIDFARMIRFRPPKELAHLARWREEMMARPAAAGGI
ncbi:glutathione S-transferase [Caulobacter sp. 1776]|uniref:glutathione S-transferase family protein n=1 Tax=Caulobacter sp. 1776 TaxID=3156420 RepID=UPI003395AC88